MERIENILVFARLEAIQLLKVKIAKIDNISLRSLDSEKTEQGVAEENDQKKEFQGTTFMNLRKKYELLVNTRVPIEN